MTSHHSLENVMPMTHQHSIDVSQSCRPRAVAGASRQDGMRARGAALAAGAVPLKVTSLFASERESGRGEVPRGTILGSGI